MIMRQLLTKYPELNVCESHIIRAYEALQASFVADGKVLLAGNGGSAADAGHIVGELMKGFMRKRPIPNAIKRRLAEWGEEGVYAAERLQGALPAISLVAHAELISAFSNDVSADLAFAQQVYGYGRAGDVLIALSTSGNSANIVHAVRVAKSLDMTTIAMTGRGGGRLAELCDIAIQVPCDSTPDVQERHLPIYHALCRMLEEAFFE